MKAVCWKNCMHGLSGGRWPASGKPDAPPPTDTCEAAEQGRATFGGGCGGKGRDEGEHRSVTHAPTQSGKRVSQGLNGVRKAGKGKQGPAVHRSAPPSEHRTPPREPDLMKHLPTSAAFLPADPADGLVSREVSIRLCQEKHAVPMTTSEEYALALTDDGNGA